MAITDLTMPLREGIAAFPSHGRSVLALHPVMAHADFGGTGRTTAYDEAPVSFAVTQWLLGDQAGTHMDAPWHADAGSSLSIDAVPLEYGFGSGVWLDCTAAAAEDGITETILADALDRREGDVRAGDVVLLRTGCSDTALSDPAGYVHRAAGLTRAAAEMLRELRVKTVGIDCVTIEARAGLGTVDAHTNFLRPAAIGRAPSDIVAVVENLVGIDRIATPRFTFVGLPLPLVGAAGSPLRAVAVTDSLL